MAVTVISQIAASADDGTWHNNGVGSFSVTGSTIRIGDSATTDDYNRGAWLRFQDIDVPQGATITSAYMELHATGVDGSIPQVRISANSVDDASPPASRSAANGLSRVSAQVAWTPSSWVSPTPYHTPDISSVIQEVILRPGWVSGNALMVLVDDINTANVLGQIAFASYDGAPANAAVLSVSYTTDTAPVADAGIDQTVGQSTLVTLQGSGTTQNGTISSYQWSQVSGTSVTLSSSTAQNPTFSAPSDSDNLVFSLIVTDSSELSSQPDQVTVFVSVSAPTAHAGLDQDAIESLTTITLNGDGSTGSPSVYEWRQISGTSVVLSAANEISVSFTAPATVDGDVLVFGLKAGNGTVFSNEDTVNVTVLPQVTWLIRGGIPVPYEQLVRKDSDWL